MALDIAKLSARAKAYVEHEALTTAKDVSFAGIFSVYGQEDAVFLVVTMDPEEPEWWVVGGSTPMNLYRKSRFQNADEAFSIHTGLMLRLSKKERWEEAEIDLHHFDAFISHASENKDELVRPLAKALVKLGCRIWYDEFELKVGDSLRKSIDQGLGGSPN